MKALTILATIAIIITSCNCQKKQLENATFLPPVVVEKREDSKQSDVPTFYYEANARGYTLSCKVENQVLYTTKEREFTDYSDKIAISDADWNEISTLVKAVDLDKVKDMKWPTEKRYYDGAAHANITFELKGVKYPANGFDHGFPPVEVEKLVNKILSLVENK